MLTVPKGLLGCVSSRVSFLCDGRWVPSDGPIGSVSISLFRRGSLLSEVYRRGTKVLYN